MKCHFHKNVKRFPLLRVCFMVSAVPRKAARLVKTFPSCWKKPSHLAGPAAHTLRFAKQKFPFFLKAHYKNQVTGRVGAGFWNGPLSVGFLQLWCHASSKKPLCRLKPVNCCKIVVFVVFSIHPKFVLNFINDINCWYTYTYMHMDTNFFIDNESVTGQNVINNLQEVTPPSDFRQASPGPNTKNIRVWTTMVTHLY